MEATPALYRDRRQLEFRAKGGSGFGAGLMRPEPRLTTYSFPAVIVLVACAWLLAIVPRAFSSTYVVYVALDDPVYQELDTLNGLGLLDDYFSEVKPIARVEAARLTIEAERNLDESEKTDAL